jgi:hypothetical protein
MIIFSEVSNSIVYDGNSPAQIQQERYNQELQQVLAQVTKLTTVPVSVVPQLATVTDPVLLQQTNQVLYEDVEVGDKVLIYQGRTIVYRPSTNEIIADTQK